MIPLQDQETPCSACAAAPAREALAQALESGYYRQSPSTEALRDSNGGYTITGVAADTLSPIVWVKHEGLWHALEAELVMAMRSLRTLEHEYHDGSQHRLDRMIEQGMGNAHACPESTACALGTDDENGQHPAQLTVHGDTILDQLTFQEAATLLRVQPYALSPCSCKDKQPITGTTARH